MRTSTRHGTILLAGLLPALLLCAGCGSGGPTPQLAGLVVGGEPVDVTLSANGLFVASVMFDAGVLPDGTDVTLEEVVRDAPDGFGRAGPAVSFMISPDPEGEATGTATIRFDPCLFAGWGATVEDIGLFREVDGDGELMDPEDFTVNDDLTITVAIEGSVVLMAVAPVGAPFATPLGGLSYHGVALGTDGSVFTWGWNGFGQLGDGTTELGLFARRVPGLSGVALVEAGEDFTVAVFPDGTARAWGANYAGQLGNGSFDDSLRPVVVRTTARFTKIAVGATSHTVLALADDGQLFAWGQNTFGQAGVGLSGDQPLPVAVTGILNPRDFAVTDHALAVLDDGTVMAWGRNDLGQLGNGTFEQSSVPVKVADLDGVVAVAAGANFSVALRDDGTVWAWGALNLRFAGGSYSRLSALPVRLDLLVDEIDALGGIETVTAGPVVAIDATSNAIVAVDSTCRVWTFDTVGPGPFVAVTRVGDDYPGRHILDIDGGVRAILALLDDGTYVAWGNNDLGQLGDGTFLSRVEPMRVAGISD